jgi:thiamine biosynthesis lipoprotein
VVAVTREWPLWSTSARVVVDLPVTSTPASRDLVLDRATAIADTLLGEVDGACSRFRADSELRHAHADLPTGVEVSPLLATLVRHALEAAAVTDGAVDPTLGYALDAVGYDRDIRLVESVDGPVRAIVSPRPGWKSVSMVGTRLRVPAHLALDLGATAKAVAADMLARRLADDLGCAVLVSLGGDISTAGPEPEAEWTVRVQDLPTDPAARLRLSAGAGMATSSTQKRRWTSGGATRHHILDPATGLPADPHWRSVTVAARSCLRANTLSTAGVVRGAAAAAWLDSLGVAARLVDRHGSVTTTGDWPADSELAPESRAA